MAAAPAAAPPAPPARGGGHAGRGRPRGGVQAHFYDFLGRMDAVALDSIITGMVSVYYWDASVLFDLRSTFSYVSSYFAPYLDKSRDSLCDIVYVSTHVEDSIVVDRVYRSYLVTIGGYKTRVDLLLLHLVDFDVILCMDWLSPYHVILDCHAKTVTLALPGLPRLEWRGILDYIPSMVVSFMKAQRMVEKGCEAYLDFVRDVSSNTPTIESVLVTIQNHMCRDGAYRDIRQADNSLIQASLIQNILK
ncbi:uncharacterized protein [Nicotiana tomentosiformis]|uniref:uncharacterized protein n=1 Tax=Nicotiana tomentosiformis TaxID=4098 RepID=UPI00388CE96D